STHSKVNATYHTLRMQEIALLLNNATELEELLTSELGQKLLEASGNYSRMALAAAHLAESANILSSSREEFKSFLEGVRSCNFTLAESSAPAVIESAEKTMKELDASLKLLAEVSDDGLLSDSHRQLYMEAIETVTKWIKALSNLSKAARLVLIADKSALENACRDRGSKTDGFGDSLVKIAMDLKPGESGDFAYEVALLKSYVLGKKQQGGGGVGTGAGWGEPSGDD
ncbi:hypothetical protein, partial [Infirmifilum sp.]|uniref:hypothetical protein n=1 Tax=Infirmifilum sp. TaxID=2856575 RepID=UPI003D0EEB0D